MKALRTLKGMACLGKFRNSGDSLLNMPIAVTHASKLSNPYSTT